MSDMSQRLAALPAERRARFLAGLRAEAEDAAGQGPASRGDTGPVPLSYAQETLRFFDSLAPDRPTCDVPWCTRLRGDLDVSALRSALAVVVARHEALRTAIMEREDGLVQVVAPEIPVELPLIEVAGDDHEDRLAAARALVAERVKAPFTLSRAPLWRAVLVRVAPGDHLFLFDAHHIVFDRWSLGVLAGELAEVYRSLRDGGEPRLPGLPVQYPDCAVWQRDRLDGGELAKLTAHWREMLAGAEVLEFPTDRPRGDTLTFAGDVSSFHVGQAGLERARELAREEDAPLFAVLVAAFFTLLHRYCGLDDLVIGSPDANRRHDSVSSVIGPFGTMMVLRGDVSGDPTFRELVQRVKRVVLDGRAHADLSFAMVADAVDPVRDPTRSPVFQIVFSQQDAGTVTGLPGLVTSEEAVLAGTSRFDMTWNVRGATEPGADGRLDVEFNTDLFDRESVARFARHYDELLRTLTAGPDAPLSAADMLSQADKEFLAEVSSGPVRPVRETTIVEQFEARVRESPDSVAVVVGDVETSYAELNARANRLAALLRERGAEPGTTIGLCLRRNVDLTTAMLAVLKTGAAYVPLDHGASPREGRGDRRRRGGARGSHARRGRRNAELGQRAGRGAGRRSWGIGGDARSEPPARREARRRRVHHLHLRQHRQAEGCAARTSRRGQLR